jgi:hypothetical protein
MSTTVHIMGQFVRMSYPQRLQMREDEGTIYFEHGGTTVSLMLTEDQADQLSTLLGTMRARNGFREMEEE